MPDEGCREEWGQQDGITFQETAFFMVTAVKTSNLT
jgi:hypothetical protein